MASVVEQLVLRSDEFAFYFESEVGVEVDALATFLKRASTIARRNGGELRVVGLHEGSLAVVIRTITKNAGKEFMAKPIDGSLKVTGLVTAISAAIIFLMSPQKGADEPISKAGAAIVENHPVTQISIVTNVQTTVVMNEQIAVEMREVRRAARLDAIASPDRALRVEAQPHFPRPVEDLAEDARVGGLTGRIDIVDGAVHFRPDGFRFWVPVYLSVAPDSVQMVPGQRYRVGGQIEMTQGQPDRIVIQSAAPTRD